MQLKLWLLFLLLPAVCLGQDRRLFSYDRCSDFLLTAPHGGFDLETDGLARAFCEAVPWNCVIATGFRTFEAPINVNRPTEGVDLPSSEEQSTARARAAYEEFSAAISASQENPAKLYVELHGNSKEFAKGRVEIATVGLTLEQARAVKELLQSELGAAGLGSYEIWIEGIDPIYFRAQASKAIGTFSRFSPALHIEIPKALRTENKDRMLLFLVRALPKAAALFSR